MELKELVGEELAGKLSAMTDETVKSAITKLTTSKLMIGDSKTLIPIHEFNEKNEALKVSKELVRKYETDLEDLKQKAAGSVTLQQQITELQSANKAAKTEFDASQIKLKKTFAVKTALLNAGVNDEEARNLLSLKFDIEKIELDDKGEVKGIVDILKPMKENPSFKGMFGTVRMQGQEHRDGTSSTGDYFTLEQIKAMPQSEMTGKVLEKVNASLAHLSK
jgi:hypothetical protein